MQIARLYNHAPQERSQIASSANRGRTFVTPPNSHRLAEGCRPYDPALKIKRKVDTNMNRTENKNRRDLYLKIRVNREELEAIDRKFRNSGMKSRSEFVRAMIFEGYIVQFSEDKMNELLKLARSISNNVNQITVRANSSGKVYAEDIADIRKGVEELWQPLRYFQSLLMTLRH